MKEAIFLIALWISCSVLAAKVIAALWDWLLLPIARKTRTNLDVILLQKSRKPAQWAVFAAGLNAGANHFAESYPNLASGMLWAFVSGAVYIQLVLGLTFLAYSSINALAEWYTKEYAIKTKTRLDNQFVSLFSKTFKFIFLVVSITIILSHFGIQITGILATAGVASLAIALAAQETLSNMIAGFALMADHSFKEGDRVELANGKIGDVIDVGLRSIRILSFDNTIINIPNSEIAKHEIINMSSPNSRFNIRASIGVAYGTDLRKAKRILMEIFEAHPDVLKEPPPAVYFKEFGESSLVLYYSFSIADYRQQLRIRDEINMAIKDRFEAERVEIPFPQRTVHIKPCLSEAREG